MEQVLLEMREMLDEQKQPIKALLVNQDDARPENYLFRLYQLLWPYQMVFLVAQGLPPLCKSAS